MTNIRYKVVETNLLKGTVPVHRFVVLHNGTVVGDTVYAVVSQKSGIPLPLVKATGSMIIEEIGECLKKGYRAELPELSAYLVLPGTVESRSAESRRQSPPEPVVRLSSKGNFKKCCQGADFVLVNVSQGATVSIDGVIDGISQKPNVLTNGENVEVHATGRGLYMPDLTDSTVGAYIADSSGKILALSTVTESSSTALVCVFAQIDLPAGTYKFCVASRNGLDPAQYGVTIGSRNVKVVDAESPEGV